MGWVVILKLKQKFCKFNTLQVTQVLHMIFYLSFFEKHFCFSRFLEIKFQTQTTKDCLNCFLAEKNGLKGRTKG